MNEPEDLHYFRFGARICVKCYNDKGVLVNIVMDMDSSRALGREVHTCHQCGALSIGEPLPPQLKKFWDDRPEAPPEQDRVAI